MTTSPFTRGAARAWKNLSLLKRTTHAQNHQAGAELSFDRADLNAANKVIINNPHRVHQNPVVG